MKPSSTKPVLADPTTPEWERYGWIVSSVARRHGVSHDDLLGPKRYARVAKARADLCACLRGCGLSYPDIGRLVGRDHSSVMSAVRADLELARPPRGSVLAGRVG